MSDSINEQRCEHGRTADDQHERNGDTCFHPFACFDQCTGPFVVTPPRQVRGFALCTEPSGVPGRACEKYEGHDGLHRLMPAVVTPPAQDEQQEERAQVEAWFARCPQGEMQTSRGHVRSLGEYDGWLPTDPDEARAVLARQFPAAPSMSTDHTDEPVTLAHVVAALSVTYKPEGVLIWLEAMRQKHSTNPVVLAEHVRRLGDADPADFTIKEAQRG
jgi:hypothetical protein